MLFLRGTFYTEESIFAYTLNPRRMDISNTESFSQILSRLKEKLKGQSDDEKAQAYFKVIVHLANILNTKELAPEHEKAKQVLLKALEEV
jgi:hypothetical protein